MSLTYFNSCLPFAALSLTAWPIAVRDRTAWSLFCSDQNCNFITVHTTDHTSQIPSRFIPRAIQERRWCHCHCFKNKEEEDLGYLFKLSEIKVASYPDQVCHRAKKRLSEVSNEARVSICVVILGIFLSAWQSPSPHEIWLISVIGYSEHLVLIPLCENRLISQLLTTCKIRLVLKALSLS